MTSTAFDELRWKKIPVLNDGFVCLVDGMGDDAAVVQAAKISYGKDLRDGEVGAEEKDETLLRYLMRNRHTTPFEMCELKFLIRIPMDAWRQMVRHRTASINEYSTRYTEAIDSQQTTEPDEWRLQSGSNKQGSSGFLEDWPEKWRTEDPTMIHSPRGPFRTTNTNLKTIGDLLTAGEEELHLRTREIYQERLEAGVSREQARKDLPLSTYTEAYWKCDLHNIFHFLGLRMDSHAQLEIRLYANAIGSIVEKLFPKSWQAFKDYRLEAMQLSRMDIRASQIFKSANVYDTDDAKMVDECLVCAGFTTKREKDECIAKMKLLGIL